MTSAAEPRTARAPDATDNGAAPPQAPLLVTVRQAAALLGIGRTTAYELIAARELEVVHIGRATRVPVVSIERYVDRLRSGTP